MIPCSPDIILYPWAISPLRIASSSRSILIGAGIAPPWTIRKLSADGVSLFSGFGNSLSLSFWSIERGIVIIAFAESPFISRIVPSRTVSLLSVITAPEAIEDATSPMRRIENAAFIEQMLSYEVLPVNISQWN